MPLIIAPQSEQLVVESVRGNDSIRKHLMNLGFVPGAPIFLSGENSSGVIVDIAGTRLALDRKTASKIAVSFA